MIYQKILAKIEKANNILLVAHKKPDPDALGSVCALACFLEQISKKYTLYCEDEASGFDFFPRTKDFVAKIDFSAFDLIIALDCGSLDRTGLAEEIRNKTGNQFVINIDHHIKIDDFADIEIKETEACAACEIVYNFFAKNNIRINKEIAECILIGILTDSGNFLFSKTNAKNMAIAARMLGYGANWSKAVRNIKQAKELKTLQAWGKALKRLQINSRRDMAFTLLKKADLENLEDNALGDLPEFLSTLGGVRGLMILKEKEAGIIQANLRSSCGKTDLSLLANVLGGGGNPKASGFSLEGQIIQKNNKYKII